MSEQIKMIEAQDIKEIMGMALANVYKLMKRPDFPAIRISARRYVVPEEAFRKWLNDQIEMKKEGNICINCGGLFKAKNPGVAKYCPDCGRIIKDQQNRDRVRKYREKKRKT